MGMNYSQLSNYANERAMEADYAANKYVTLTDKLARLYVLQDCCNFNVFEYYGDMDFVAFVIKNKSQLKRKFSYDEYISTRNKWWLCKKVADFAQLKNVKIRFLNQSLRNSS